MADNLADALFQRTDARNQLENSLILVYEGADYTVSLETLGIDFNTVNERDVIGLVSAGIREQFNLNVSEDYKASKAHNSRNIYLIPNSTAG